MGCLFKAHVQDGHTIKILAELLQHCFKDIYLRLSHKGISFSRTDVDNGIVINFRLLPERFLEYQCARHMTIEINVIHLYKMLRMIKKKVAVILFITTEKPNHLGIKVSNGGRMTTSWVKFRTACDVRYLPQTGYGPSIAILSSEYSKMCREFNTIGKYISITSNSRKITFTCEGVGMYMRETSFGEEEEDDRESEDDEELFEETYYTKQFTQLMKISGLSLQVPIRVFARPGLPLKIKTLIGNLGSMRIYIKSNSQMDDDKARSGKIEEEEEEFDSS